MRINKFLAQNTQLSRRSADAAVQDGRVTVNGVRATLGSAVTDASQVTLDGAKIIPRNHTTTLTLHKPVGYVCSRNGQGSPTVYELLPPEFHALNMVGRLDKDSSGLLLLTDDGDFANHLTHPKFAKAKRYEVTLDTALQPLHQQMISDYGVTLGDGKSTFVVTRIDDRPNTYEAVLSEGRNRQIRRTFAALGYTVTVLHRTNFGPYALNGLQSGSFTTVD
ncbi:MAG: rRNA synthase [Patescibacteria group bacterium]|nr:rRNA pseudouridine synthase [Candidatus Saccharibacteria bacterium]MDQ5963814.1 rRNA synthase [Patescibacteria group bacterium]